MVEVNSYVCVFLCLLQCTVHYVLDTGKHGDQVIKCWQRDTVFLKNSSKQDFDNWCSYKWLNILCKARLHNTFAGCNSEDTMNIWVMVSSHNWRRAGKLIELWLSSMMVKLGLISVLPLWSMALCLGSNQLPKSGRCSVECWNMHELIIHLMITQMTKSLRIESEHRQTDI